MAVINIQNLAVGLQSGVPASQVNATPQPASIVFINTDDTSETVQTTGYLNPYASNAANALYNAPFVDGQWVLVYTTDEGQSAYQISISGGDISLVPEINPGSVTLPVTSGHFAVFDGTEGVLKDAGYYPSDASLTRVVMSVAGPLPNRIARFMDSQGTIGPNGFAPAGAAVNPGDIQAGLTGAQAGSPVFGRFIACPPGGGGSLNLQANNNASSHIVTIINNSHAQTTSHYVPDTGLAEDTFMTTALLTPDAGSNLIYFDITVTAAALATGGTVTLYASSGSKQYKVRNLWVNGHGTNFSGGGGDRLLSITDGTTVYGVVQASALQALANTAWGDADLVFPPSAAINTSTAAGQALRAQYSGGAADYSAGSVVITGVLQRVA